LLLQEKIIHFIYNFHVNSKNLAAIDIGTNTLRLLIATISFNPKNRIYSINEKCSERIVTRLGDGIHTSRLLKDDAITRSIAALQSFSNTISHSDVYMTSAIATSALREAENSGAFLEKAREAAGLDIHIVSGKEEAEITSSGMLIDIKPPDTALMADIGGGSTELIFYGRGKLLLTCSLDLGVVYLAGKYMKNDPPLTVDLDQMRGEITDRIMTKAAYFGKLIKDDTVFLGTAGTITALAAMSQNLLQFDHDKVHNFTLSMANVKNIFSTISVLTSGEREKHIPFEPARLDIIVPGTLILLKLMETFDFSEIMVSSYGLREGILVDLYKKICN
jgi:exopolyphosphatase/guanosine-5'-triphosphate,3'-diphosphate pyrophosphatase